MTVLVDSTLPGLAAALDPDRMLERLRRKLPERDDDLEPVELKVFDIQYKPGVHCKILYQLKFRDRLTDRSSRELWSACLLRADEERPPIPEMLSARYAALNDTMINASEIYVPEERIVMFPFPLDLSMPWLFDALDPSFMKEELNRMWSGENTRARKVGMELLGYTPQSRATFLYEVLRESRDRESTERQRLVGKVHAYKHADRLFANMWALWRAAAGRMGLAQPVGYISPAHMTLQQQVHGERLGGLVTSPNFIRLVRETARQITALHGLSLPLSTERTPQHEAQVVHRWAGVLAGVRPDLARPIERLGTRLAAELESTTRATSPIHGDFHHTNPTFPIWLKPSLSYPSIFSEFCMIMSRFPLAQLQLPHSMPGFR